jgi:hypothetical protein
MISFNVDDRDDRQALMVRVPQVTALPRRTVYGYAPGLVPFGDAFPDKLVQPADYKEVIAHCHDQQIFPLYHQRATWAPPGFQWNQNGLNYCWAWSATAALMDLLAREGKPVPVLSPVSLGWTVNWRNDGNYLESGIKGLMERGVCEMKYTPDPLSRSYRNYEEGWEANALGYRLGEVFDADNTSDKATIQHALTILSRGVSGYVAYNWWGHAVEVVGLRWDESLPNNVAWIIRNSHNEDDVIELTGSRGVPDEFYGFSASLTAV